MSNTTGTPQSSGARKSFSAPRLDELGALHELTRGDFTHSNEDAILGPNQPPNPPNTFIPPPPDPS